MEAWLVGAEEDVLRLGPGDIIALPANIPHRFRNGGDSDLRLLGIHTSPTRIVHRLDGA